MNLPQLRVFVKDAGHVSDLLQGSSGRDLADLIAARHPNVAVAVETEAARRSDVFLQQLRGAPIGASLPDLGFDSDWARTLTTSGLAGDPVPNVVVLSTEPDLRDRPWLDPSSGLLIAPPPDWETAWTEEQRAWLTENCRQLPLVTADEWLDSMSQAVAHLRGLGDPEILVITSSSYDPDDATVDYHGVEDTLALRIQQLNLAALKLSVAEGVAIVDVDRLIAEMGGRRHVESALRYSDEAQSAIRQELVRVVDARGVFDRVLPAPWPRRLVVPFHDRRIDKVTLVRWHRKAGEAVVPGDPLFDVETDSLAWTMDEGAQVDDTRSLILTVSAAEAGVLRTTMAEVGEHRRVGDVVGVVHENASEPVASIDEVVAEFRVGSRIAEGE